MTGKAIRADDGMSFQDGDDHGRVLVFGNETGGRYSLMEFTVAARPLLRDGEIPDFDAHRHRELEETFFVRRGALKFLIGEELIDLEAGDFVRVAPGQRHGYANVSGREVDLQVSYHPGGFEELFVTHRSDQMPPPAPTGFMDDAIRLHVSEFED